MTKESYEMKEYESPKVLNHQPIRFETAQSWNKGRGNLDHPGTGNGGINYPNPPYSGPHNGNGGGNGKGNGKG
ncbi:hypothetical protein ACFQ88_06525 [Paenibacillus sp. NPDC056579]|uniref:hypothetical protein n=1 Tax=unclassified Paenibacillus TaxID=185978 RepID=UPI001EF75B15|nr:hypothetical protein [Paenibacillus sp. H1-7]ULL16615.1 hypothetical protein DVH26_20510 [Paenibacillus sp. H1-7]